MNWRPLLALPLAAFLLGDPVDPPHPMAPTETGCPDAEQNYLFAYAYRANDAARARAFALRARKESSACPVLSLRIDQLLRELLP